MARASAQKKVRDLARDQQTALLVWRPQLAVLRREYELVAERAEESIQTLKEVKRQAKGCQRGVCPGCSGSVDGRHDPPPGVQD